jgi:hypothetical protein
MKMLISKEESIKKTSKIKSSPDLFRRMMLKSEREKIKLCSSEKNLKVRDIIILHFWTRMLTYRLRLMLWTTISEYSNFRMKILQKNLINSLKLMKPFVCALTARTEFKKSDRRMSSNYRNLLPMSMRLGHLQDRDSEIFVNYHKLFSILAHNPYALV